MKIVAVRKNDRATIVGHINTQGIAKGGSSGKEKENWSIFPR